MTKQIQYLFFLFLFWAPSLAAQQIMPVEQVFLHTDRQLYAAGETIWFKVFLFLGDEDRLSDKSKVVYLELLNEQEVPVAQLKILLQDGQGEGSIVLPESVPNGQYRFWAYTSAMRNYSAEHFGQQLIYLVNPRQPILKNSADAKVSWPRFRPEASQRQIPAARRLNIEMEGADTPFRQRAPVTLEIQCTGPDGNPRVADLSVSVALKSPVSMTVFDPDAPVSPIWESAVGEYPLEEKGMVLRGSVMNEQSGQGAPDINLLLAFPGKRAVVYSAITDSVGRFSVTLPPLFGLKQLVIQFQEKPVRPLKIILEEQFEQWPVKEVETPRVLPPEWEALANATSINAQVGTAYQVFEPPARFGEDNPFEQVSFFGKPHKTFLLDDYTRFPLPEFFFEVVPEVKIRGKFGEEELSVTDPEGEIITRYPPLLLVDGVPVLDQRTFLQINNKLIKSAEVIQSQVWLNPGKFGGLVQLQSFEADARCFKLPETALQRSYLALLPRRLFEQPDYPAEKEREIPDFRNTLYWNARVKTNENGRATVHFSTSDVIGDYEIRVEAVSKKGFTGSARKKLVVEK
ncbi:MAG TPA: MG2 domain-containing protein [Saprospiraceae bacterium]|nr:MG2 domain-containing protein [Saprospiraceae bacterium]